MNLELGEEQKNAISSILDFLKTDKICISLVGAAGTGKSFTISQLLPLLKCEYQLCAPTHKAALVMRKYCNANAITIHSLLALSPVLDITKFDILNLSFFTTKKPMQIPNKGLVICDEASMINDDLFDLIIERCKSYNSKILFVSDKAQLLPVKSDKYSKVYTACDEVITLNKIYRQASENCLMPILTALRKQEVYNFTTLHSPEGNLNVYHNIEEFAKDCAKEFKISIKNRDILNVKLLAYTNKAVKNYNKVIQRFIWNDTNHFHVGDILTAYDSGDNAIMVNPDKPSLKDTMCPARYYNGMDYIITDFYEGSKNLLNVGDVNGIYVTLYDAYKNSYMKLFIVTDTSKYTLIAEAVETLRMLGVKQKKWRGYFNLTSQFCTIDNLMYDNRTIVKKTFDLGYCCTIHKSQGSSYNKVYVDINNLRSCRESLVRRQLEYVAFSRTRTDVCVYEK